jgi:dolichol-phosphate mannosyltransferase
LSVRIGLAVPLLDEGALVDAVAARLLAVADQHGLDLILCLVDNGSRDDTRARVRSLASDDARIRGVYLDDNAGYGGGILSGVRHLVETADPDLVGWTWGDGQVDPAVLPALVRACTADAMLAKARRVERQDGWRRVLVTRSYAATLRALGVRTPDVNGCPKLLRREAWAALDPQSTDWFLDPEVVLGAEERGWRIADAPVVMAPRAAGASKVRWATLAEFARNLARWRGGWRP